MFVCFFTSKQTAPNDFHNVANKFYGSFNIQQKNKSWLQLEVLITVRHWLPQVSQSNPCFHAPEGLCVSIYLVAVRVAFVSFQPLWCAHPETPEPQTHSTAQTNSTLHIPVTCLTHKHNTTSVTYGMTFIPSA